LEISDWNRSEPSVFVLQNDDRDELSLHLYKADGDVGTYGVSTISHSLSFHFLLGTKLLHCDSQVQSRGMTEFI
jgi:hypothetical protein